MHTVHADIYAAVPMLDVRPEEPDFKAAQRRIDETAEVTQVVVPPFGSDRTSTLETRRSLWGLCGFLPPRCVEGSHVVAEPHNLSIQLRNGLSTRIFLQLVLSLRRGWREQYFKHRHFCMR